MIQVNNLTVWYQSINDSVLALDRVSLDIADGEIITLIGPSGSGKSTFLYVLAGIQKKYAGIVTIGGHPISPKTQRVGMILQNYGLLPWKNVRDNALLGVTIKDGQQELSDYGHYILQQLDMDSLLDRYPKELSGGQRQRVAIARAFIMKPDLLLMDEPFSALDAITREEMQALFLNIWKQNSVTTVFVTHSVDEALYLGSKIVVLSSSPGRVLEIIDNPCFQMENLRLQEEYHSMSMRLRKILIKD